MGGTTRYRRAYCHVNKPEDIHQLRKFVVSKSDSGILCSFPVVVYLNILIVAIVIDNNSLLSSKLFGKLFQFVVGLLDV